MLSRNNVDANMRMCIFSSVDALFTTRRNEKKSKIKLLARYTRRLVMLKNGFRFDSL